MRPEDIPNTDPDEPPVNPALHAAAPLGNLNVRRCVTGTPVNHTHAAISELAGAIVVLAGALAAVSPVAGGHALKQVLAAVDNANKRLAIVHNSTL